MPVQNERDRRLINLWLKQSSDKRTMQDLREFCTRLRRNNPELLPLSNCGNAYQHIKGVLVAYTTLDDAPCCSLPTFQN
jgi:hypothetical protein